MGPDLVMAKPPRQQRRAGRLRAIVLSVALHGSLLALALLTLAPHVTAPPAPPTPQPGEVVQATVVDEAKVAAEVAQLERGLGPRLRDEPGAREESVVRLAGEERPVDEDARGRATLALGRVHGSTPAAVARGATSKPRRAYARHRTRK